MHFADLFSLVLENQGISECIGTIPFGKTNQHSKIEYGSSVRHRDVEVCSVGALAMNLFSRFHFENEPFPDFTRCENWYETVHLPQKNVRLSKFKFYLFHAHSNSTFAVSTYQISRDISTVTDVWREYNVGFPGNP
ncbi:unnamed protein product [Rhizopus microsporus]